MSRGVESTSFSLSGAHSTTEGRTLNSLQLFTHSKGGTYDMRKAISLRVDLWIEADDEPGHDFAASTKQAVSDIIAAGSSSHPELSVAVKSIVEAKDDEASTN
jgi:hypothetical protein